MLMADLKNRQSGFNNRVDSAKRRTQPMVRSTTCPSPVIRLGSVAHAGKNGEDFAIGSGFKSVFVSQYGNDRHDQ